MLVELAEATSLPRRYRASLIGVSGHVLRRWEDGSRDPDQAARRLVGFLTEQTTIRRVIDFGDAPVFQAIAYASILLTTRQSPAPNHQIRVLKWGEDENFDALPNVVEHRSASLPQQALKAEGWHFDASNSRFLERLMAVGKPLKDYVDGRCYRGIMTGLNEAFVIDDATRRRLIAEDAKSAELIKRWLRGRDVKRWKVRWDGLYAIVFPHGFHEQLENYPAVLKHLTTFEADLRKRGQCVSSRGGGKTGQHHWLELDDNPKPSYLQEFRQPKVIIPAIERGCAFAFDEDGFFPNDKTTICVSKDARFLCGILNSSVTWWIIRQIAAERQNDYYEFKPMYVSRLPIPSAPPDKQKVVERLVDRILAAKQRDAGADVSALEREIDQLVYALHGLTPEEIKIVESART